MTLKEKSKGGVITMAETKINIQELNQLKNPTKTPDGL
jgi:hypothetical protein